MLYELGQTESAVFMSLKCYLLLFNTNFLELLCISSKNAKFDLAFFLNYPLKHQKQQMTKFTSAKFQKRRFSQICKKN